MNFITFAVRMVARVVYTLIVMYAWIVKPDEARNLSFEGWIIRAYRKKQWIRAESLCHEWLALAERLQQTERKRQQNWNYGNAIHNGNQILGLIRLHQGDIAGAKQYLLAAGLSPGSPVLNSHGPKMILARALLERGERSVVSEYVNDIAQFWAA
jgi:hypothetical protein